MQEMAPLRYNQWLSFCGGIMEAFIFLGKDYTEIKIALMSI